MNTLNITLIAELFASLARIASNPAVGAVNTDVAKYAGLLSDGLRAGALTEADLQALKERMDSGVRMSGIELDDLAAKIRANSAAIQGAGLPAD